jgi:argininosuccinate synthase
MQTELDRVAAQFAGWRQNRTKRSATPAHLKRQAVSLVGQYPKADIVSRLGINSTVLAHWMNEPQPEPKPKFIELTDNPVSPSNAAMDVTIALRSGAQVKLSGHGTDVATLLLALQQGGGL